MTVVEPTPIPKIPRFLRYQADPLRPGFFIVTDDHGTVWAEGIGNEAAARVFAASPQLLLGYDWMLEEVLEYFHVRWDIGIRGPDFHEFVEDEGELEEKYPGAPEHAEWLQNLRDRSVRFSQWESPVEEYVEPQLEMFDEQ
jgi:hypothetical protein